MATTMIAAFLLLLSMSSIVVAAGRCTEELLSFSACLAYVSSPPNKLRESGDCNWSKCCNAFSSAVESLCLCYLVRDPNILGFPLNTTTLLSLSSLCSPTPTTATPPSSFDFLCSASPALPPLNTAGTTSPHITTPAAGGRGGSTGGGGSGSGSPGEREGEGSSGSSSRGAGTGTRTVSQFPFKNGPSTRTWNTHTLLPSQMLTLILVTLTLNTRV